MMNLEGSISGRYCTTWQSTVAGLVITMRHLLIPWPVDILFHIYCLRQKISLLIPTVGLVLLQVPKSKCSKFLSFLAALGNSLKYRCIQNSKIVTANPGRWYSYLIWRKMCDPNVWNPYPFLKVILAERMPTLMLFCTYLWTFVGSEILYGWETSSRMILANVVLSEQMKKTLLQQCKLRSYPENRYPSSGWAGYSLELTANCLVETLSKIDELIVAVMVKCELTRYSYLCDCSSPCLMVFHGMVWYGMAWWAIVVSEHL